MKIYVYYNDKNNITTCHLDPQLGFGALIQTIEAVATDEPITENWKGNGIEIGEVFCINASHFKVKLKRIN